MDDFLVNCLPYSFSGLLVGVLVGLTGVGGGSLMTPLLILLFHINPASAVGTDLLFAGITKSVGTSIHGLKGSVDWSVTRRLASGSIPATILTLLTLSRVGPQSPSVNHLISGVLGVALILTAILVVFRTQIINYVQKHQTNLSDARARNLTIVLGAVLGILVSISSVGAGAIGVTILIALYPKLPLVRIVGSDIAHAVPLTIIAGLGHWMQGSVDWPLLVYLILGSIPGIIVGSLLASYIPERILRTILAAVIALVGYKLAL